MTRTRLPFFLIGATWIAACAVDDPATTDSDLRGGGLRVRERDLTSDVPGAAMNIDRRLVNAWGLAIDPDGPEVWIAANGNDSSEILAPSGKPTGETVSVPGAPTGLVYTESPAFLGDEFIFATEGGTIAGWQDAAGAGSVVRVDDSASGAIYKGLAVIGQGDDVALATTDFHGGSVDVYDAGYVEREDAGFVDRDLPVGFAPFGIAQLGNDVYVSYAEQDADGEDDVAGPGNGFVDVFRTDGTLVRRLISGGQLNSPWGMTIVSGRGLGPFSHLLLVGNFGDGAINAYDPRTGQWRGQLRDEDGAPLAIDGLWTIAAAGAHVLFTAGPEDESHGLYGELDLRR